MSELHDDILKLAENWSPEAQAFAAEALEAIRNGERRAWYCKRGRKCDGKAHEGYPYPHARSDQWPPPGSDWFAWFLSSGRGSGKTRTGSEYTLRMSEKVGRIALIAPTGADVRDTIIEGESGLQMAAALAGKRLHYEPSKRRLTFPSGCIATTFSGEEPARLRGPQFGFAWLDEPAHMPLIADVWDMLMFGLRLGARPHVILTSTPLPTKWVKEIQAEKSTRVVRVSTFKNKENLAPAYIARMEAKYAGTRTGLQELEGRLLSDVAGALWNSDIIHRQEIDYADLERIVVAIDPAGSNNRRSDETGIVVAGILGQNAYVLHDGSGKYSPKGWADEAMRLYKQYDADALVVEVNFGADMVEEVITRNLPKNIMPPRIVKKRASRGKQLRAEPVVALYEQGRVFHWGNLADLEDEMLTWIPGQGDSPNRVDALVWAITDLLTPPGEATIASPRGLGGPRRPPGLAGTGKNLIDFSKIRRSA
jgi:phage terminase large subunit-like protein